MTATSSMKINPQIDILESSFIAIRIKANVLQS
jgi:hypothetical protein